MSRKRNSRKRRTRRQVSPTGGHTIPNKLKTTDVSQFVVHQLPADDGEDVRRYVEWEARGEKAVHAECLKREFVFGEEYEVWDPIDQAIGPDEAMRGRFVFGDVVELAAPHGSLA